MDASRMATSSLQTTHGWMRTSYFLQLVFPIHLYNFTSHQRKDVVFKGGCINWLGKSPLSPSITPTTAMWRPQLWIRNRPSFQKYGERKWGVEKRWKKKHIQTGGLAELMGTRRGAFLQGNHLHNGKWLEFELRALLLWEQSVKWKGRVHIRWKPQYHGALRGRCILVIWSFASCHLSSVHFICKTIYQHSLRRARPILYVLKTLLLKKTAAAGMLHLHSANESGTIASSRLW